MIGKAVLFKDIENNEIVGLIYDKVRVLIVGTNSNFDNYVLMDDKGKIHIVNPININRIVLQSEYDELNKKK